jgi:purine-nucleoside phosphorylase
MYKTATAADHKKHLKLPHDYRIDGMLCYGTWDIAKQIELFKAAANETGKEIEFNTLPGFLGKIVEFTVERKRYWFDVSYGGALLSEFVHLACMFGSKKNIVIGSCGGLSQEVKQGDFIIPTYSFGNESATRMYNPEAADNKHYADEKLSQSLQNRVDPKYKVWHGPTTTSQAMLAETEELVTAWSEEGFLAVEMETSTVFAVSKHFSIPAAALLFMTDNLIQGETVLDEAHLTHKEKSLEIVKEQYRVALLELLN